jgi:hypothetical protein
MARTLAFTAQNSVIDYASSSDLLALMKPFRARFLEYRIPLLQSVPEKLRRSADRFCARRAADRH